MRAHPAVASAATTPPATVDREYAMNKLRLRLDDLTVDTFQTGEDRQLQRGTVDAHEATKPICTVASLKTDLTCCPCTPML